MSKPNQTNAALDEAIRKLAHEIWEAEGQPEDRQTRHWFRAAAMLRESADVSRGAASGDSSRVTS